MNPLLRLILLGPPARKNLVLALVVGTILNAINQGDAIVAGEAVEWGKFLLNYCVPFIVASFGSYNSLRTAADRGH